MSKKVSYLSKRFGVKRAAVIIQRTEKTVYRMVEDGELPHFRVGGQISFTEEQLIAYLQSCERPGRLVAA